MQALKFAVITMGILIVIGVSVIVVTLFNRLSAPEEASPAPAAATVAAAPEGPAAESAAAPFGTVDLGLPAGSRIVAVVPGGRHLFLHVSLPGGGERVIVAEAAAGRVLGAFDLGPATARPGAE